VAIVMLRQSTHSVRSWITRATSSIRERTSRSSVPYIISCILLLRSEDKSSVVISSLFLTHKIRSQHDRDTKYVWKYLQIITINQYAVSDQKLAHFNHALSRKRFPLCLRAVPKILPGIWSSYLRWGWVFSNGREFSLDSSLQRLFIEFSIVETIDLSTIVIQTRY